MNRWKDYAKKLAPFSFLFLSFWAYGADSLSGIATVLWQGHRYDMAVKITDPAHAVFEVLDDLGNSVLKVETSGRKTWLIEGKKRRRISDRKFRKLLFLPLSPAELVCELLKNANGITTHALKISWQQIIVK